MMRERLAWYRFLVRNWLDRKREKLTMRLAWMVPRSVAYFVLIRIWAHATQTIYQDKEPDELTWGMALKAWERG